MPVKHPILPPEAKVQVSIFPYSMYNTTQHPHESDEVMKKYLLGSALQFLGLGAIIYTVRTGNGYEWQKLFLVVIAIGAVLNLIKYLLWKYATDRRTNDLEGERLRARIIRISLGTGQEMEKALEKDREREEKWKKLSGEKTLPRK